MTTIRRIHAREVLDSRGKPTLEVEIQNSDGSLGRAIVPSGASTGSAEALELRDGDRRRYDGQGVSKAVAIVRDTLGPALIGADPADQAAIDGKLLALDSTPQKSFLGGNSLLAVSLAAVHAGAAAQNKPLFQHFHELYINSSAAESAMEVAQRPGMPVPMTNMISGGLHAGGNIDFQDILIMPVGAPDYATGLEWIVRVYRRLGEQLQRNGFEGRLVGDEGGYGPRLPGNREAVAAVVEAIHAAGLKAGQDVVIALDVAATHFFQAGSYQLASEGGKKLTAEQMVELLDRWVNDFPIMSIEDGLAENDWEGWKLLTKKLGDKIQLVGDDLFTTNASRVRHGIELGVANSVLIKVNQIGTIAETFRTIHAARSAGYSLVVSARSGETEDTTIADLAVGVAAEHIKIGSIVRSERLAKYNQLLRIQEQLTGDS